MTSAEWRASDLDWCILLCKHLMNCFLVRLCSFTLERIRRLHAHTHARACTHTQVHTRTHTHIYTPREGTIDHGVRWSDGKKYRGNLHGSVEEGCHRRLAVCQLCTTVSWTVKLPISRLRATRLLQFQFRVVFASSGHWGLTLDTLC